MSFVLYFSVRGVLGTFLVLTCNVGVLLAFVLGYFFDYVTVAWLIASLSILFIICFWFMPETPQHLVLRQRHDEAEKSLRYYRNIRSRLSKELNEELQMELNKLRATDNAEKSCDDDVDDTAVTWSDFSELLHTDAMNKKINVILFCFISSRGEGTQGVLHWAGSVDGQSGLRLLRPAQLHGTDIRVGGLQSDPHDCGDYRGSHPVGGDICVHHVGGAGGSQAIAAHLRGWVLPQSAVNGYAYLP